MTALSLNAANTLPQEGLAGCFVGRVWRPGTDGGPTPVLVSDDGVFDLSSVSATLAGLLAMDDPVAAARAARQAGAARLGEVADILGNSAHQSRGPAKPYFPAPTDLPAWKACGV
ncbi:MAG: fumarylacetoacetate hydrolase, partial [Alphaproteobacteria bacterium]|nr:fumarylacetoacetate hydrolase [Alphaproteobacteria bacterium]